MNLLLSLETGDVTSETKGTRRFHVEVDRPPTTVALSLADRSGRIAFDDWLPLVEQIQAKELVKRHSPDSLKPPLSLIPSVIQEIKSTPTYQLFLAGVDVAERIDLVSESPPESVKRRFLLLDKWLPSATGAGGLFFLPADVAAGYPPHLVQELILNNKLCLAAFADTRRLYVPYATPIGFITRVSREAEGLWDEIRALYYAFRDVG